MKWTLPLFLFLICGYLIFFPELLRPELLVRPLFSTEVRGNSTTAGIEDETEIFPFMLDDIFGYVFDDGTLGFTGEKLYGVAIEKDRFINYSSVSGNLVVQDPAGNVTETLEVSGYPVFLSGRFFVLATNRADIREIGQSGAVLWRNEYSSIITDIGAGGELLALAFLDGRVLLIDGTGALIHDMEFPGSRVQAVYGCSLSADGSRLAVVHGLDPQHITVVALESDYSTLYSGELDDEVRRRRNIGFFHGALYVEEVGGLRIIDYEKASHVRIAGLNNFAGAGEFVREKLVWYLSKSEDGVELSLVRLPDRKLMTTGFQGKYTTASSYGDKLLVGMDRYITMMEITQR